MKDKIWYKLSLWRDKDSLWFLRPLLDYLRYEVFYPSDHTE